MKRTALKRGAPMKRSAIVRKRKTPKSRERCPVCKVGRTVRLAELVQEVEVCPGYAYKVVVRGYRYCDACGAETYSERGEIQAKADAYAQHRAMILDRDSYCCVACGGTERLSVHHVVFRSREQGPMRHHPDNLQTLCGSCHDAAHGRGRG